ncbi:MAG: ribosome biogenesis GTPase YlqF [Oscillospiraceae bacterium]|nr:ribosome biogenesis GTPase YlqF [Oscillospiraceae bacterium]MBR7084710.1 ribosome biogenesis GTPase YlqF [Oscillospiraceae bacterium]
MNQEIQIGNIQWFPGHMTKTKRMITANLSLVDGVVSILDARIPFSSCNPDLTNLIQSKPYMVLLNKSDMADPNFTSQWVQYYRKQGIPALAIDCISGKGTKQFTATVREQLLKELIQKRAQSGMTGRPVRLMIVGIPNVGKSSFINKMAKSKRAKVEDRPGVTRTKQWVKIDEQTEFLDMPGVLAPKLDDQQAALRLAFTGAIRDQILDTEALAMLLLEYLHQQYPNTLKERYKLETQETDGDKLLEAVGRKRGMLLSGGVVNTERAAITVLDDFRAAKLGRITLELPPQEVAQ